MHVLTQADDIITRMATKQITVAQAYNELIAHTGKRGEIDEVDGIYKFYQCPDGSRLGARIREREHDARWPRELQQVWVASSRF